MENRHLLILSYHFPPSRLVGALRPLRFARHLPRFDWRVSVLTVRADLSGQASEEGDEIPPASTTIHRTRAWLPGQTQWVMNLRRSVSAPQARQDHDHAEGKGAAYVAYSLIRRLADMIVIPDEMAGWVPFAVTRGSKVIREDRPDALMVSSPPQSSLLAGWILSKRFGVPWVADMRDPWTADPFARPRPWFRKRLEYKLESSILLSAAHVLVTTKGLAERLLKDHPDLDSSRISLVRHGFDPELFASCHPYRRNPRFTATYTGSFYGYRRCAEFLRALRIFLDKRHLAETEAEVRFIGNFDAANRNLTGELLATLKLEKVVHLLGSRPHSESVEALCRSDVLLFEMAHKGEGRLTIPAKIWEYLASGRPVLAMVPEGSEAASTLVQFGRGTTVSPPGNVEAIASALGELYDRYRADDLSSFPADDRIERLSTPHQVELLARILNEVADQKH